MIRRLVPVLLLCLAAITLSGAPAAAQTAQAAPALTILNLTESAVVVRDQVTFRLGLPAGAPKPAGACADWLPTLQAQSWQLFVQGAAAPATQAGVSLECEGASVVRATVRLLYHGLPQDVLKVVEPEERNIWIAFGGRNVQVNVGPAAQPIGPVQTVWVRNTATWQRAMVIGTLLVGTAGFVLLVFGTNIARNPTPPASVVEGVPLPEGSRPSFSLSRMQFLWWLFIITMCFMVIVTLTGRTDDLINSQTLVLLGIVGGTSLLSVTQDQRKADDENQRRAALAADYRALAAAPAAGTAPPSTIAPRLASMARDIHDSSRDFFNDLLTDANGLSVHRLQLLIWTVVLGVVFMVTTMRTMVMPDLDPNLLVLMGISSGTYFGFKLNETQVPPALTGTQPAPAAQPAPPASPAPTPAPAPAAPAPAAAQS